MYTRPENDAVFAEFSIGFSRPEAATTTASFVPPSATGVYEEYTHPINTAVSGKFKSGFSYSSAVSASFAPPPAGLIEYSYPSHTAVFADFETGFVRPVANAVAMSFVLDSSEQNSFSLHSHTGNFLTQFGVHRYTQWGEQKTNYGPHVGRIRLKAPGVSPNTRIGKPLALGVPQVGRPKGLKLDAVVGYAHCYFPAQITIRDQTAVTGFKLTSFGQASSPSVQLCEARDTVLGYLFGVAHTATGRLMLFGTHDAARSQAAASTCATAFGAHNRVGRFKAASTQAARFGAPTVNQGRVVTGHSRVRFGRHISRQRGFRATGLLLSGRMGWPTCSATLPGRKVSGFKAPAFGTHNVNHQYRALHIWPQTRFGCPLMKRFI